MSRRSLIVASLLLIPAVAVAQRRGGGGGFGRDQGATYGGPERTPGLQLSNGDVEDMNPLKLLIDKRKDLQLNDDKVKQIKDVEKATKQKAEASFKSLDSLRRIIRGPNGGQPSEEDRSRMMSARSQVMTVVTDIRLIYDAGYKEVLPLLDETQQKAAADLVQKQNKAAEETLKEKMSGGRGGGRRGG
jgi:hypothetical protein